MRKNIYIIMCTAMMMASQTKAQTYLNCDFADGIPASFTLIDNDQNEPSVDMKNIGFAVGTPWIVNVPANETDPAACSTSWYTPSGQSDDWMITPPMTIDADNVILSWRAKASDKRFRDGYAVYISTTAGTAVADFDKETSLFSVDSEESAWTEHTVSLDAYKGKTVTVAFVNNSNNKSRLYVDDIYVGAKANAYVKLDLGIATPNVGDLAVSGVAFTKNETPVSGYTIGLEYGGQTFTQHFDGELTAGTNVPFTLDATLPVAKMETVPYTVWIEADGTKYTQSSTITSYQRKVVCDDVTGTWCGWCVRGLVALDNLRKDCSDWTIGMAAHSGDVMYDSISNYIGGLSNLVYWSGLPAGVVNHKYECDPGDFAQYAKAAFKAEPVLVAIDVTAERDKDTNEVEANATLRFANDNDAANYHLAFVLIENRIHQPGNDDYRQHNSYSGGESGKMGGYEDLPDYVPSELMYFDDVVRCTVGDFNGIEGSVPAAVKANEPIAFTQKFTLPSTVLNAEETELVALLIDQSDKHVVNAEKVALGNGTFAAIRTVGGDSAAKAHEVARYSLNGTRLATPQRGVNIVKMSDGRTVKQVVK